MYMMQLNGQTVPKLLKFTFVKTVDETLNRNSTFLLNKCLSCLQFYMYKTCVFLKQLLVIRFEFVFV